MLVGICGRRVHAALSFFPYRQLVYFSLGWQLRANVDVDNVRPSYLETGKLWAVWEENPVFTQHLGRLLGVTKEMNQRPVNMDTYFETSTTDKHKDNALQCDQTVAENGVVHRQWPHLYRKMGALHWNMTSDFNECWNMVETAHLQ